MKYYFDESGSFRVPMDRKEHAAGIVVGLAVPGTIEQTLERKFVDFVGKLPKFAFRNGEPKGSLLDGDGRRAIATLLSECDGILVCPAMLDLTTLAGHATEIRDRIAKRLEAVSSQCKHESMQRALALLARQIRNLSPEAAFRLGCWAQCIKRCISDSVVWHSGPAFNGDWENLTFEIDAVQPKPGSREEQVFTKMLPAWVTSWSQQDPFTLIEDIHTANHPFVQRWDTPDGFDLGKMFRDNVRFCSSKSSVGLQLADMAASVTSKAVVGVVSTDDLTSYGIMMSKSIRSATHAHGIFSFGETDASDIAKRYCGLVEAVLHARDSVRRAYATPN